MTPKNIHTCCMYWKNLSDVVSVFLIFIIFINEIGFRSVKNCFIRGSVVRYVQLPGEEVDTQLLQDAARKEAVTTTR